jgi:hydroxymethylglutaryl-CoA lyase
MVHMFHEMGITTGVDLDALLASGLRLRAIVQHELDSSILRAGKSSDLLGAHASGQTRHEG